MMKKTNEKKVLHKVKKRWVILGTALFALTAAGAYPETANADTADNHSFTQSSTTASNANQSTVTGSASATSNPSASSSNTPSSSSANNSSTTTTTQSSGSASSSDVTSGSSSATSSSSSASSSATSTAQNGELLYRYGGDTNNSVSNRPSGSSATNLSLVDSKPSVDSISTFSINSISGNRYSLGVSISGNASATYHAVLNTDNKYYIQFANSGSVSPITGVSNVYQHIQLSGGSEESLSADSNAYSFNSDISKDSISVTDSDSKNIASNATQITFSNGPYDSKYNNQYYAGDKVWWTFDVIPNSNSKVISSIFSKDDSNKVITNTTPIEIQFLNSGTNQPIKSSEWLAGDNIYPNNTFGNVNIPANTINNSGYNYSGAAVYGVKSNMNVTINDLSVNNFNFSGKFQNVDGNGVMLLYNPINLSGSAKYIDTDNQNSEIASSKTFSGTSGTTVDYPTQSVVNSLTSEGYSLTSDSPAPSNSIIINSNSNDYTFKFTHKTSATSESKTLTRTINFIDSSNGQSIQTPASQTVTYNRSGTYDEVAKTSSYGNWTTNDSSFAEYAAPSISGYNDPQPASVAALSVDVDAQPSSTSTDIKYTKSVAATFSGSVKYIDTNNGNQEIPGANSYGFNGTVGDKVNYSTQNIVDSLTSEGYSLTSDSPAPSASIIINSSSNDYTFKFTHKTSATSESKTFTRTINFIDSSTNQSIQTPASQTVTYNRSGVYDEVTKTSSYGNWTTKDGSFSEYTAPSISGYNDPQPASVAASSVDADKQSAVINTDIKYTKSVAATFSGSVKYIDANNGNQEIPGANSYGFNGFVGDKVNYSTQSVVNSLTSKGYSLVSGVPATSDNIIVNSSNNDYTFQFVHKIDTYFANSTSYPDGLVKLDFEKTFTRNINFMDSSNGQPIQSSAVQTVTYSRSATYDEVTNATSYSDWKTSNGSFHEYSAPSISGYNNPQPASVPASSVSDTDAQSTSTSIEYTKSSSAPSQTPSSSVPSSSAAIPSFAPVPTSIQSSSSTSSYQSNNSSSVTSTIVSSANSSAEQVVVASVATKMYNNQTQLVKSGNQILIYIEPRYANNTGVASATDSYVVNIQNSDGTVSHDQLVTLDQYNAMLMASGKAPYTPEDLQQAYNERKNNQGILDNDNHKTTFDARTVQKGNDTFIFTDNKNSNGDFKRPKDGKLVLNKDKKKHSHKSNKHSFKNKKKQIKNKRNHMKTKHHHTKKNHSHHKK